MSSSQRPSGAGSVSAISCDARMHELGDLEDLAVVDAAPPRARAAKRDGADLQLGDADRVLVGHAERELARGLGEQAPVAVGAALDAMGAAASR